MRRVKVGIFGTNGMLGQYLSRQAPASVHLVSYGRDIDITDASRVEERLLKDKPEWIINAAAYSDVDGSELDPKRAFRVNAQGVSNLVRICQEQKKYLIHFSTDYVFSGEKNGVYNENDPTAPRGNYALSKLEGEKVVQQFDRGYIFRVTSLYGMGRDNHALKVMNAIRSRVPTKIAVDMLGSPTFAGDLADWIYSVIQIRPPAGLYHLCHSGICSRMEFAEALCQEEGIAKPYPVDPIRIADLKLPAPRPLKTGMSTQKWQKIMGPLPSWKEGMKHFLVEYHKAVRKSPV